MIAETVSPSKELASHVRTVLPNKRLRLIERQAILRAAEGLPEIPHPKTRGECEDGPRPCPLVGCRYHLFLEVRRTGSLKLNYPGKEPEDLLESCALDVADRGEHTLEQVGAILEMTRERVRQLEVMAFTNAEQDRQLRRLVEDEDRLGETSRSAAAIVGGKIVAKRKMQRALVPMFGRRIGIAVVLERAGSGADGSATWSLRCDCGVVFVRHGSYLRSAENDKRSISCGCQDRRRKRKV